IRYSGRQTYKDSLGLKQTYVDNGINRIKVKSNMFDNIRYSWTLGNLMPNMLYTVNISSLTNTPEGILRSYPAMLEVLTDFDAPPYIESPVVSVVDTDLRTATIKLKPVSEKNGVIDKYYVVVQQVIPLNMAYPRYSFREENDDKHWVAACIGSNRFPLQYTLGTLKNTSEIYNGQLYVYHNAKLQINLNYQVKLCVQVITYSEQIITDCSPLSDRFRLVDGLYISHIDSRSSRQTIVIWVFTVLGLMLLLLFVLLLLGSQLRKKCISKPMYKTTLSQSRQKSRKTTDINGTGLTSTLGLLDYQDVPLLSPHSSRGQLQSGSPVYDQSLKLNGTFVNTSQQLDPSNISTETTSYPVSLQGLPEHVEKLKSNDGFLLSQEFEAVEPTDSFAWQASVLPQNRAKNRYANILSYDHTRVVLPGSDGDDYINANYIDGFKIPKHYIATQGPLPTTFADFWLMVWNEDVRVIVMLTKLVESKRLKCDQYWPVNQSAQYGSIEVCQLEEQIFSLFTVRYFRLTSFTEQRQQRTIAQLQFTAWPDCGVPENTIRFLYFLRIFRHLRYSADNPPYNQCIVHCSAGVGRTGCFIALDCCCDQIDSYANDFDSIVVDVRACLTKLRSQRNYMIQTEEQLGFTYDCLSELARSYFGKLTRYEIRPLSNLRQHIVDMLTLKPNQATSQVETEFRRLASPPQGLDKFKSAHLISNRFKNRLMNIVPFESNRVTISHSISQNKDTIARNNSYSDGGSNSSQQPFAEEDYINASFIDGYLSTKEFIAAQGPLSQTVEDFWRMIWQHECSIVVMLTNTHELGKERCSQYWPTASRLQCSDYQIETLAEYDMNNYILREWKLTNMRSGQHKTIRQFHFTCWPEQGVPRNTETFLQLFIEVKRTREQFGLESYPIIVHGR
ncbi:hypothetical protein GJ496_008545, partial [Pomphorhynchus laevis]